MNKQDLVEALSARLHKSQRDAAETIDALVEEIKKAIAKGESIRISGFGAFEQTVRNARQGRNPRTGEPVKIAPTRVVRFRPAADFKAIVAGTRRAVADAMPGGGQSESEPVVPAVPAQQSTTTVRASSAAEPATEAAAAEEAPARKATPVKRTATASRSTARKTPAKTAAKATPTKAAATKAAATKTAATKAAATKAAATKAAATKAAATKTAATKTAAAKRATAKKATAPAAKKTSSAATKRTAAKKPAAPATTNDQAGQA